MPQIDDVVGVNDETDVVDTETESGSTNTVDSEASTEVVGSTADAIVEATTVDKPKRKVKTKTETTAESTAEKPAKKTKKAKKETAEDADNPKLIRPPMDVITRDFEQMITDHEIGDNKLKKLGYKCGKILFGIPANGDGKDFRVAAYKARKKTRTVSGKSRCIFYFGLVEDATKHAKDIVGVSTTKFGKCAVQSKTPIQLILDKVTYNETFGQDSDKVSASLKKLIDLTVKQRTASWKELQKKKTEKKETNE